MKEAINAILAKDQINYKNVEKEIEADLIQPEQHDTHQHLDTDVGKPQPDIELGDHQTNT